MKEKISRDPNDRCKMSKVRKGSTLKKDAISKNYFTTNDETAHLVIEFDYGQNYPIPHLNINSQFKANFAYKRML